VPEQIESPPSYANKTVLWCLLLGCLLCVRRSPESQKRCRVIRTPANAARTCPGASAPIRACADSATLPVTCQSISAGAPPRKQKNKQGREECPPGEPIFIFLSFSFPGSTPAIAVACRRPATLLQCICGSLSHRCAPIHSVSFTTPRIHPPESHSRVSDPPVAAGPQSACSIL